MPAWGNKDNAANTPLWAATAVNVTPNSANRANLFNNITTDYWKVDLPNGGSRHADQAIVVFGVDAQEASVDSHVHTGWVQRTAFTGGRAGRIQEEVLVALSNFNGTDADAQIYANVKIALTSTSARSVVYGGGNTAVFTVSPTLTGNTAAALTYQWQVNNGVGGVWVNAVNNTPANTTYAGATTATLTVTPTYTDANGYKYRVIVTAADQGVTATSANSTLTVTA